jgi:hypothetical protein
MFRQAPQLKCEWAMDQMVTYRLQNPTFYSDYYIGWEGDLLQDLLRPEITAVRKKVTGRMVDETFYLSVAEVNTSFEDTSGFSGNR